MSYGEYISGRQEKTEEVPIETKGISDGNHFNGANFTSDGEWIYFIDHLAHDGIYRFKKEDIDKGMNKISDVSASNINITEHWIYYQDPTDDNHIYRIKKDGSDKEKSLYHNAIGLRVINDTLYYKDFAGTNNRSLYQSKLSSATTTTFSLVDHLFRFTIHQGNVFYLTDDFYLFVTDLDPNNKMNFPLTNHQVGMFQAKDGFIYYENRHDGNTIYRTPTDGERFEKLTNVESQGFNVTDDSIYFTNVDDNLGLYKYDLETRETTKLDDRAFSIQVIDDLVFYQKHISNLELGWFVINKDGSNPRRLYVN
nr:DUF5050 domain-containing protein [Halalkalibacter alkaliphilus]